MRTFDFVEFCIHNNIDTNPLDTGGKWININCPFCEDDDYHMGFNLRTNHFNCYKCGWHTQEQTVAKILQVSPGEAKRIVHEYRTGRASLRAPTEKDDKVHAKECFLPLGSGGLKSRHLHYLKGRGFKNPSALAQLYGLKGTGCVGDYGHRIVAPIFLKGRMVSYQARDITGKSKLPYKACAEEKEVIHHKHLLYAEDLVPGDTVVVVEGIVDAWKLGPGAVATFGIGFSMEQVRRIARFKKRLILYDQDAKGDGQKAAKKLVSALMGFSGETARAWLADLKKGQKDPGDLPEDEARKLMKGLL